MADLTQLSLLEAFHGLRRGDFSAEALARACLERIQALDDRVHAFLTLTPELALEQARSADRSIQAWRRSPDAPLPPLMGIPLAIKDVLCLEGVPTTCGSRILEGFRPPYTATSVERLLQAGAIALGKTNTDEFAMGSSTENSAYGPTHNPWDLARVPGGSSGGSAAAVAARMCPAALGTDTGGSVRQPASFCGLTGLKTSYGRVSRYGLIAYGSSLDTVGALARSAQDLLPIFLTMAGYDPLDSTSLPEPLPEVSLEGISLKGWKIGVPKEYFIEGMQEDVESAIRAAVSVFEAQGAEILEISLAHTDLALPVYYLIAPAEASANLARYDGIRFGPRLEYDAYYGQAQKVRTLIRQDFEQAFEQVDLIACPVAPTTAFRIGEHGDDPLSMYLEDVFTLPANLAGVPGMAFPVGFDRNGLPIGMQLNAPHLAEARLFQATHAYQSVTDWHRRQPELSREDPA